MLLRTKMINNSNKLKKIIKQTIASLKPRLNHKDLAMIKKRMMRKSKKKRNKKYKALE